MRLEIGRFGIGVVIAMAVTACGPRDATIEDTFGGRARVLAVDGHAPQRASSKYVTVIPVVVVGPGEHAFRVVLSPKESGAPAETLSVSASTLAGRRYRFREGTQGIELIEWREP
jgi:hypothetical protein